MRVRDDVLMEAMKIACKVGIFPKHVGTDAYLEKWEMMRVFLNELSEFEVEDE